MQVILPETLKGRCYHTSVIIYSSPKIRIICFGGLDTWPEDDGFDKAVPIAQTTIVELCKCALHTGNVISKYHNKACQRTKFSGLTPLF